MSAAPRTPCRSAACSARDLRFGLAPVERVTGRDRNGDPDPGAARELLARDARRRERVVDAML